MEGESQGYPGPSRCGRNEVCLGGRIMGHLVTDFCCGVGGLAFRLWNRSRAQRGQCGSNYSLKGRREIRSSQGAVSPLAAGPVSGARSGSARSSQSLQLWLCFH